LKCVTVNGQEDAYMNWKDGQPDKKYDKCVMLNEKKEAKMSDSDCEKSKKFSCRFSQNCP